MKYSLTAYDPQTGRILQTYRSPQPVVLPEVFPGVNYIHQDSNFDSDYVLHGIITPRPRMILRLRENILSGVPAGATITIEDQEYQADGTKIELDLDTPGKYQIGISLWPYFDEVIEYEVTA